MSEFTDRFFIMLLAFIGFGGFLFAIAGGWIMSDLEGTMQYVAIGGLGVIVVGLMIGIWHEFNEIDRANA